MAKKGWFHAVSVMLVSAATLFGQGKKEDEKKEAGPVPTEKAEKEVVKGGDKKEEYINEQDLEKIYRDLRAKIKTAKAEADKAGKPFYIVSGEVHISFKSMYYTHMLYEISKELGINYMPELDKERYDSITLSARQLKEYSCIGYPTFSHFVKAIPDKDKVVLVDLPQPDELQKYKKERKILSELKESAVLVAVGGGTSLAAAEFVYKKLFDKYDPVDKEHYKKRNENIIKTAKGHKHGYLQLGQAHVDFVVSALEKDASVFVVVTDRELTEMLGRKAVDEELKKLEKRPNTYLADNKLAIYIPKSPGEIKEEEMIKFYDTIGKAIALSMKIQEIAAKIKKEEEKKEVLPPPRELPQKQKDGPSGWSR